MFRTMVSSAWPELSAATSLIPFFISVNKANVEKYMPPSIFHGAISDGSSSFFSSSAASPANATFSH